MNTTKFVTFGETLAQHNAAYVGPYDEDGEYMLDCAGAESNVAVDIERLGVPGLTTVWVSNVGDDEAGAFILDQLKDRTTTVAYIQSGQRTAISYLNHLADGRHVKTYQRKGSAASRLTFREVEPHLRDAGVLHVTGITPALSDTCRETVLASLEYAREHGIPVSFDLNWREQLWDVEDARRVFERMVRYSTLFKIGHDEAEAVWQYGWSPEKYAEYFQRASSAVVVITLGDSGALAFDGSNWVEHAGFEVDVVDPVGAGDAFVAGLLGGILGHCSLREFGGLGQSTRRDLLENSLRIANACGALTCTRRGDTAAMPTMAEVNQFIAAQAETEGREARV